MSVDWLGLTALLAIGLVVYVAALTAFVVRTLTRPPRRGYAWAVARGVPGDPSEVLVELQTASAPCSGSGWSARPRFKEVVIDRGPRTLRAWDIEGLESAGPVVVLTHGWGDSRVVMLSRLPALMSACSRIVIWDLPGHGDTDSQRRERCTLGVHERIDLMVVVDHVIEASPRIGGVSGEGPPDIVLMGFSLGAGVSLAAAKTLVQEGKIAGVIAEAPYRLPITPARNVLRSRGLPCVFVLPLAMALVGTSIERSLRGIRWASDGWSSHRASRSGSDNDAPSSGDESPRFVDRMMLASSLPNACRLLVLHGERDEICPLQDAEEIAKIAGNGTLCVIPGAGHTNMWTDDATSRAAGDAVRSFLAETRERR
ncbi:MAG: alpha/beta hydrolase [Phycisphaeraceae bacterium]|nr:alpha/beta hydrolase [Phycisphaeraceae bacterium]